MDYTRRDARLDDMIRMAEATGLTLDEVVAQVGDVDQSTFRKLAGNPSALPRYIQSKVRP